MQCNLVGMGNQGISPPSSQEDLFLDMFWEGSIYASLLTHKNKMKTCRKLPRRNEFIITNEIVTEFPQETSD